MAWTAPMTAVAGAMYTSAAFNTYVRDNLLETAPAKALTDSGYFVTAGTNQIAERSLAQKHISQQDSFTSTSYADPDGSISGFSPVPGPAVTVKTGSVALVMVGGRVGGNSVATASVKMSWAASGTTTIAATDLWAAGPVGLSQYGFSYCTRVWLATGLTQGNITFTAKYAVSSGTGYASYRTLTVMPF